MPRLRLGIDYRPALLGSSGIGRAVRELCRALAEEPDCELHLFAHSWSRARRDDPIPGSCHLHRLPIPGRSLPPLARLGIDASFLCGRVPLFHWTDYIHPPLATGVTGILTLHDLAFAAAPEYHGRGQSEILLARCRTAAARAARILCPTAATAAMVVSHLGVDEARTRIIPFGCDHVPASRTAPVPTDPPMQGPYVVTVGTVEPRKNHRRLLAAWRQLGDASGQRQRPRLVVLGRRGWECDAEVAALESAVREEGVVWRESPSDAEVFAWMAHARLLAYPSRLEGFGFPPLEAMALGTPVVAGDTPALREVLGEAARFCDPDDTDDLARQLANVLEDTDLHAGLVARGRVRAGEYTWQRAARAHLEVYREVQATTGG